MLSYLVSMVAGFWIGMSGLLYALFYWIDVRWDLPVTNMETASSAHSRLQRLIQRIIEEALHLPAFLDFSGSHRESSGRLPEFNPKTYEDLLATAILNKVIDRYQQDPKRNAGASSSGVHSGSSSPGCEDIPLSSRTARRRGRPRTSARDSSPEPLSHDDYANSDSSGRASASLQTTFLKHDSSSEDEELSRYKDPVEAALSSINFHKKSRVVFPEYGGDVIDLAGVPQSNTFILEGYTDVNATLNNNTEIYTNNNSWEENWLFQKKKLKNSQSVSVPMLVPNPNTEYRALIGDRDAEDTTDLSEAGSDSDEKAEDTADIKKVLINSKTIIGGKNPVLAIIEQVDDDTNLGEKDEHKTDNLIQSEDIIHVETNNNVYEISKEANNVQYTNNNNNKIYNLNNDKLIDDFSSKLKSNDMCNNVVIDEYIVKEVVPSIETARSSEIKVDLSDYQTLEAITNNINSMKSLEAMDEQPLINDSVVNGDLEVTYQNGEQENIVTEKLDKNICCNDTTVDEEKSKIGHVSGVLLDDTLSDKLEEKICDDSVGVHEENNTIGHVSEMLLDIKHNEDNHEDYNDNISNKDVEERIIQPEDKAATLNMESMISIAQEIDDIITEAINTNIEISKQNGDNQVIDIEEENKDSLVEHVPLTEECICENNFISKEIVNADINSVNNEQDKEILTQEEQLIIQAIKDNISLTINRSEVKDILVEHEIASVVREASQSVMEDLEMNLSTAEVAYHINVIESTINSSEVEHLSSTMESASTLHRPEVEDIVNDTSECAVVDNRNEELNNNVEPQDEVDSVDVQKSDVAPLVEITTTIEVTNDNEDLEKASLTPSDAEFVDINDKQDADGHQRESEYIETIAVPIQRHMDSLKRQHNIKDVALSIPSSRLPEKQDTSVEETFIPGRFEPLYLVQDYVDIPLTFVQECQLGHDSIGSIAEREHLKWQNAVPMENNPYSPEAIQRRLQTQSRGALFCLGGRAPSVEGEGEGGPVEPLMEIQQEVQQQESSDKELKEYKRYGRDYYINESKTAKGGRHKTPQLATRYSYEEYDNVEVERPTFVRCSSEAPTPTWKNRVSSEENYRFMGEIDRPKSQNEVLNSTRIEPQDGVYSAQPATSEPDLYCATPVLLEENIDDQFDSVYDTSINNELSYTSPDENDSRITNGSATQSDLLDISDCISSPDDTLHIYNIQSGKISKEANTKQEFFGDNADEDNTLVNGKITSTMLNNINKSWKSTGDVYLAAIEVKSGKEKTRVIEEDIDLPSVKSLRRMFVAEQKEPEIPKPVRKMSKELPASHMTKTYSSSQHNLRQPIHMHSLTARSIPKEFRDELRQSMPAQGIPHPGGSKEIPQGVGEPVRDRPESPQPEPGSLRNKLAFFEQLNKH